MTYKMELATRYYLVGEITCNRNIVFLTLNKLWDHRTRHGGDQKASDMQGIMRGARPIKYS